ncbi:MAG: thioredoxin domain-containing protein [Blastocatellales bacterium]|nr:thioredoxin domain-containing protein [Blastocatellales bacterium]
MPEHKHTNRLIHETSPYLLQHAHNPVDWHPWGEEALERARTEDKAILLSIGYSACHWCHVMEHESFENEAIAKLMNDNFINIKVDREERPDLDAIYMSAVQMMTGHGGWPMTVFLTPDQVPFYGGTYFPPEDRYGIPGFPRVLISIAEAYHTRRDEITSNAQAVITELRRMNSVSASSEELGPDALDACVRQLMRSFDPVNGGFGSKPKFPPSMTLSFLLRHYHRTQDRAALAAVELTLGKMAHGGIYDQLGGGFHRYSVDEKWLVPHFEKMLYDNAQLARLYTEAWLATGRPLYRRIAEETLDYVLREMTDARGGFYSTQDADSEGEEGKFFVWTPAEIRQLLGDEDAALFCRYYDVTDGGNFEEKNILHVDVEMESVARLLGVDIERMSAAIERGRGVLFEARERRIKPGRDEKMLTAWNGLMLRAFAEAANAFGRADYRDAAVRNAEFVLANLKRGDRLLRTHRDGESKLNAYLEDYAYFADGLLALYEATFDARWFTEARALAETMIEFFHDETDGGFFFTSIDHEALIARTREIYDNATPAGNSVAADVLLRLSLFTGEARYRDLAERTIRLAREVMLRAPSAFGRLLCALDLYISSPLEIAVVGDGEDAARAEMLAEVYGRYMPNRVVAASAPDDPGAVGAIPLLAGRRAVGGRATAYVCRNFQCEAPITEAAELAAKIDSPG